MKQIRHITYILLIVGLISYPFTALSADKRSPVSPSKKDKCPVCGMFVTRYPDWIAQILFKDGSYVVFDGVKDMMKFYLNIHKYSSSNPSEIDSIYVKDYYSLKYIDARKALYVIGSDVQGPMGMELIPFSRDNEAKIFMKDHRGQKIMTFQEITTETIKILEQ